MSLQSFQPGGDLIKDAAFLSLKAAYPSSVLSEGKGGYVVSDSANPLKQYINENGSWKLIEPQTLDLPNGENGFYTSGNAAAFAATKGDTLAIVIRGSDLTGLSPPMWGVDPQSWTVADIAATLAGIGQGYFSATVEPDQHYQALEPFFKAVLN